MSDDQAPPASPARDGRDEVVARALAELSIPPHRPGFWDDLDARLATSTDPFTIGTVEGPTPVVHRLAGELPLVAALRPKAEAQRPSRRTPILAAAVAAMVLVLAVGLVLVVGGDGGGGDEEFADAGADSSTPENSGEDSGEEEAGDEAVEDLEGDASTNSAVPTSAPAATTLLATSDAPEAAVRSWLQALGAGATDDAAALTGPRTLAYIEAQSAEAADLLRESEEAYGAWADVPDVEFRTIELGAVEAVDGQLAVVVVSGAHPDAGASGEEHTDAFPVVDTGDGWRVEHLTLDPEIGRPQFTTPSGGDDENAVDDGPDSHVADLGSMGPAQAIEVFVPAGGTVHFQIDGGALLSDATSPVGSNDEPFARIDPGGEDGELAPGTHVLVLVAVGDDGSVICLAGRFTVEA